MPPVPPSSPLRSARRPRADAAERILRAAVRRIVISGAVALTMHEVAEEAEVSKGLIHYHFHDKDTLLARVVEWITRQLIAREGGALAASSPRSAIDDLWRWVDDELARGQIRVLIELAEWRSELVQGAVRSSSLARRGAASVSVDRLFSLLGLHPRVPPDLLADTIIAFTDGLAVQSALHQEREVWNPRAAFDVFWLALLSLAE